MYMVSVSYRQERRRGIRRKLRIHLVKKKAERSVDIQNARLTFVPRCMETRVKRDTAVTDRGLDFAHYSYPSSWLHMLTCMV